MTAAPSASGARLVHEALPRDVASRHLRAHADGSPLYPAGSFASPSALARRAAKAGAWDGNRAALVAWLAEQNAPDKLGAPHAAQAKNLADAARPDALFVTTGQQPGLLGGPAMAWCKAMTAVAWARACAARLGRPVIPVFWVAGDDSDLAESNAVEFLEPGAPAPSASLAFGDPDAAAEGLAVPMSLRLLEAEPLRALWEKLPPSWGDSKNEDARVLKLAQDAYAPGRSLTEAFVRLLQTFLGSEGVLFVDGFSAARRPEAQALLRRIAGEGAVFQDALLRGTARLRETLSLPPQVPVRPGAVPAFLFEDGERKRLFFSDSRRVYAAGAEDTDLRATLSDRTLLHSALSRPLVVDALFPVLGHVLGPAETRYFAQIADAFPVFGRSFPLLALRAQALVVPEEGLRALEALGFSVADLIDLRPSRVREILTEEAWKRHPAAAEFPEGDYRAFRDKLADYQGRRFAGGNFEAALRRLDRSFGNYREQARRQVFTENAAARFRALQPLLRWIAGGLQDRHLNLLSLRAALGEAGFAALAARLRTAGDATDTIGTIDMGDIGATSVFAAEMKDWKETIP